MTTADGAADDPTIGDDVSLWRRVPPQFTVFDHNLGCRRPSSQAFQNYRDPRLGVRNAFSVCISCDAEALGAGPRDFVAAHPGYGVASFSAGLARQLDQGVVRVPQEGELAHGHVVGDKPKRVIKAFALHATFLIEPAP